MELLQPVYCTVIRLVVTDAKLKVAASSALKPSLLVMTVYHDNQLPHLYRGGDAFVHELNSG